MKELMTTLERYEDFSALLTSGVENIVVSLEGLSSTVSQKLNKEELEMLLRDVKSHNEKTAYDQNAKEKVSISIRANQTFHEGMLKEAEEWMQYLSERKDDLEAILFADPSLFYLAKKYQMVEKMIYDPETLMTSINDANWWIQHGVKGIAISPLLTLQETEEIASKVEKAVVTVHGRTMMARSYRKLLTAYQETYDLDDKVVQNKNLYLIEKTRDGQMPVYEDETGTLIYSENVLDSFDFIEKILESHPMGLLIEGCYLPLEEQLQAIKSYRRILNGEDPVLIGKEYREQFAAEPLDSGYYEQKTVK